MINILSALALLALIVLYPTLLTIEIVVGSVASAFLLVYAVSLIKRF